MKITYGATTLELTGALAADSPMTWDNIGIGSIRRTYTGKARVHELWDKQSISISWTGINGASALSLGSVAAYGSTLQFTEVPLTIADALGTISMKYVPLSLSDAATGFNLHTISLSFEEA